jgi:hypothetical protein
MQTTKSSIGCTSIGLLSNNLLNKVISRTEKHMNATKINVAPVPLAELPKVAPKKHRYDGVPVEKVAKDLRAILKHFKYGMTADEKTQFANLVAKQSHCASGTAARIAGILGKK